MVIGDIAAAATGTGTGGTVWPVWSILHAVENVDETHEFRLP